jgi:hypothetical protein
VASVRCGQCAMLMQRSVCKNIEVEVEVEAEAEFDT